MVCLFSTRIPFLENLSIPIEDYIDKIVVYPSFSNKALLFLHVDYIQYTQSSNIDFKQSLTLHKANFPTEIFYQPGFNTSTFFDTHSWCVPSEALDRFTALSFIMEINHHQREYFKSYYSVYNESNSARNYYFEFSLHMMVSFQDPTVYLSRMVLDCIHKICLTTHRQYQRELLDRTMRIFDTPVDYLNPSMPLYSEQYMTKRLFSYQRENVRWCLGLERRPGKDIVFSLAQNKRYLPNGWYCTSCNQIECFCPPIWANILWSLSGGILADEMGLGKTITMLGLIQESCPYKPNYKRAMSCSHVYQSGPMFRQFCCKSPTPDSLFCNLHKKSIYIKSNASHYSKDTPPSLILVKGHMVHQWLEEALETCPNLNIVCIRTLAHLKTLSLNDIKDADIVILNSKVEQQYRFSPEYTILRVVYKRVIYDENQESSHHMWRGRPFRWLLSGSIEDSVETFINHVGFHSSTSLGMLDMNANEYGLHHSDMMTEVKVRIRRNTMQSVYDEWVKPIVQKFETCVPFALPTEKGLYEMLQSKRSISRDTLLRVCTHMDLEQPVSSLIQRRHTLNEIQNALIQRVEQRLQQIQNNTLALSIHGDSLQHSLSYLRQLDVPKDCPICLEEEQEMCMTSCGHAICTHCIRRIENSQECPICKSRIESKYFISVEHKENPSSLEEWIHCLQSTKLGHLIHYLKQNKNERIILYSQYTDCLRLIFELLHHYNIPVLNCSGTIYMREHVIYTFKSTPCVLLLSTMDCAAGLNLTCATTVIFLEPYLNVNSHIRLGVEKQALARVMRIGQTQPIKLLRFVIENTIDQYLVF